MLKTSIVILIFSLVGSSLSAQKKSTAKENKIRAITEYKQDVEKNGSRLIEAYTLYDNNGNVVEEKEYDTAGKTSKHMKYQYNSDNNKIQETEMAPDGKIVKTIEFKYNGNLKIEKNVYDAKGKLKTRKTYQYEFIK